MADSYVEEFVLTHFHSRQECFSGLSLDFCDADVC